MVASARSNRCRQALDQAGDYIGGTHGGHMMNLCGLEPAPPPDIPPLPKLPAEIAAQNGIDIHAGLSETSRILSLKPSLVSPQLADAPNLGGTCFSQLLQIALDPAWSDSFGAPRHATAPYGTAVMRYRSALYTRTALAILDGKDERDIPPCATAALEAEKEGVAQSRAYDETERQRQAEWLKKKGLE